MTRAILYAAESAGKNEASVPSQLNELREYAAAQKPPWIVREDDVFSDAGASAYSGSRGPGLASARARCTELAKCKDDVVLLVFATDRLARGDGVQAAHLLEYVLEAAKAGYRIESVLEDIGGDMGLVLAALYGQRNPHDSKVKSAHIKRGMREAGEAGKYLAVRLPARRDQKLVEVPDEGD